jgi:branched-chain amino acid transport system ATP-binding protein
MLALDGVAAGYGDVLAVHAVTLEVREGEAVALIGANGAGKTTTLNGIAGLVRPSGGKVRLADREVTGLGPDRLLRAGLALVPERRRIFIDLTVGENLKVGGVTASRREREQRLEEMTDKFPVLRDKWSTAAGFLSGGEAQQLAIARALMSAPRMLLMDEPTLGLAPTLVDRIFDLIVSLRSSGVTMLVVEQNATRLLEVADRAYVMRTGGIAMSGRGADLLARSDLFESYVGETA